MDHFQLNGDPIHVVAAIVWHPNQLNTFLISRRQQGKHLEHLWELPGGKKEPGENREQALKRELAEEINIRVICTKPFMQVTHEYCDRTIFLDVWQVSSFEGNVSGREGQEIRWIEINELNDYQFPEADTPILDSIKSTAKA